MDLRNLAINSSLAITGVALWSYGATRLAESGEFDYHPNPLGLKMSPYGQVIALAMQGGVEHDWHGAENNPAGHVCDGGCSHEHDQDDRSQNDGELEFPLIEKLQLAVSERTNPRPVTPAHRFYLRRQIEDRLRLAYQLDPSNYANYNSYHLFLTEPQVGTRPVLSEEAVKLAKSTIAYSLREKSDPRPALTAASAACNILQLLFQNQDKHSLDEMREQLQLLDFCMARHHELSAAWLESGGYENLSAARQQEMLDRLHFCTKVRDASEQTIRRLSSSPGDQASLSW
ncbi:hypothetical protein [Luteolibacter marinus]|uniref:hypothetical protein n=1 Tax=Luteolibacter marinus TaxID=2776705 RepID=UPI0018694F2B|nr:hypothetical protein [Luteolibacter marinus]